MRVLIVGGYGVFGGRLARLLVKDGFEVIIAGRDPHKAAEFSSQIGCDALEVDVAGNLAPIAKSGASVVVDAAGPFQAYGSDPYCLARFCIEHGINYLDLSDDAAFTAGIAELDAPAAAAGCFVLSGVSSVPAISAAAVRALSEGLSELIVIETSLVPGNRAPRGRSVVASILTQTGEPLCVWRGSAWRQYRGWSNTKTVCFGPGFKQRVYLIGAPDLKLFPQAFAARTVIFRAGLELAVMRWALSTLGFVRSRRLLPKLTVFLSPILWLSQRLEHLGSDRGAMAVEVVGLLGGEPLRRRWQIIAYHGDGPFIPAVPARAIIRKCASIRPGARPSLFDLSMPEIESALAGLSVQTTTLAAQAPTLIQKALEERWKELPPSVKCLHSVQDLEVFIGKAKVTRGRGVIERAAAFFFNFPKAGENVPVTITKTRTAFGEIWERNFGGRRFRSYLTPSPRPYHYRERFFVLTYEQELPVDNGSLFLPVRRGWLLGVRLPGFLLPKSQAREYDLNGVFHFDVGLYAPLTGRLIVRYQGHFTPA
jgi:saccharopine dehydrogenase-like NADP-dependent oxidoreductase